MTGQWEQSPAPHADFVALVAQITAIGRDVAHLVDDQRETKGQLSQFIIEHRSTHMEDRQALRETLETNRKALIEDVDGRLDNVKAGRRLWIGVIVTFIGLLGANLIAMLLRYS